MIEHGAAFRRQGLEGGRLQPGEQQAAAGHGRLLQDRLDLGG